MKDFYFMFGADTSILFEKLATLNFLHNNDKINDNNDTDLAITTAQLFLQNRLAKEKHFVQYYTKYNSYCDSNLPREQQWSIDLIEVWIRIRIAFPDVHSD